MTRVLEHAMTKQEEELEFAEEENYELKEYLQKQINIRIDEIHECMEIHNKELSKLPNLIGSNAFKAASIRYEIKKLQDELKSYQND